MANKPLIEKVLLIDDDEDDCMVFQMAVAEINNSIKCLFKNSYDGIAETIKRK